MLPSSDINHVQQVFGTLIYYAIAVGKNVCHSGITFLPAIKITRNNGGNNTSPQLCSNPHQCENKIPQYHNDTPHSQ